MVNISGRDAAVLIAANSIPLLGVFLAGWDAFTLLMLYWFESAVIGFWVCCAVAIRREPLTLFDRSGSKSTPSGIGAALFIAAHAGIFMFVHLSFLIGFSSMTRRDSGEIPHMLTLLLVDSGLWMPLAGLFLLRGLMTVSDHVGGRPLLPTIVGFYLRIFVMQFVILAGGFFVVLLGGNIVPLILLIVLRAAIDLGIEPIVQKLVVAEPAAADAS